MTLDDEILYLQGRITSFQRRLDALLMVKCAGLEAVGALLRGQLPQPKVSPLKGRKILEDYECAVSTAIKRRGGIKIPADLHEEFGGWARLHNPKALAADELAEELHSLGLIEEPTTNALLDGLKSGRKSARFSETSIDRYYAEQGRRVAAQEAGVPF